MSDLYNILIQEADWLAAGATRKQKEDADFGLRLLQLKVRYSRQHELDCPQCALTYQVRSALKPDPDGEGYWCPKCDYYLPLLS